MAKSEYNGQGPLPPRQGSANSLDDIDRFEDSQRLGEQARGMTKPDPASGIIIDGGQTAKPDPNSKSDRANTITQEIPTNKKYAEADPLDPNTRRKMEEEFRENARGLDLNGDGKFSKEEAQKIAEGEKKLFSGLDPELKEKAREGFAKNSGSFTDEKFADLTGLKVEKGATDILKNGMREGLDITDGKDKDGKGKDGKGKDGKGKDGEKKENNFFETILELIKTFAVALGLMEDPNKNKDTAAAQQDAPKKGEEKTTKGEGQQTEKEQKLTQEEKKGMEFIATLDKDIQNSIKSAGLKDTGIMLAGLPKEFTPNAQIIGAKLPASDLQERG